MQFEPKNFKKNGFFVVFRSTLKRFEILLHDSDEGYIQSIVGQSDVQGVSTIKEATFYIKKCVLSDKGVKKMGFPGSSGLH